VPFQSMHPATIDAEYLRGVWRPDAVHAAALRDWASIQLWAQEYATQSDEQGARQLVEQSANGHEDLL